MDQEKHFCLNPYILLSSVLKEMEEEMKIKIFRNYYSINYIGYSNQIK